MGKARAIPPPEFTIVIDTREKDPFLFPNVPTQRATLKSGDYSIAGLETQVAIERKRPVELFTNYASHRDRFRREHQRLQGYQYAAIVIEGSLPECSTIPHPRSSVAPSVVFGTMVSWATRFGVHPWFATDRRHAEAVTLRLLRSFWFDAQARTSTSQSAQILPISREGWTMAQAAEHDQFVTDAIAVFRGAWYVKTEDGRDADVPDFLDRVRELSKKHFASAASPVERWERTMAGLSDVLTQAKFFTAMLRGVRLMMLEIRAEAEGVSVADVERATGQYVDGSEMPL